MVRFIVHGGYGKTATTFFQENIFPHLDDVLYLGKRQDLTMRSDELRRIYHTVFPSFVGMTANDFRARNSSLLIPLFGDILISEMRQGTELEKYGYIGGRYEGSSHTQQDAAPDDNEINR